MPVSTQYSCHVILDDYPHKVTRSTCHGRLIWRYTHAYGVLRIPSLVACVGDVAYHRWWQCLDRSLEMSYLRQVAEVQGRSAGVAARDTVLEGAMPAIHEYLTSMVDVDGGPRVTATLSISTDGDRWLLRLSDRQTAMVCFHAGQSLQEALQGLEERLQAGTADWRQDAFAKAKKKKG